MCTDITRGTAKRGKKIITAKKRFDKTRVKSTLGPLVGPTLRVLDTTVSGKHIFTNRFTYRISLYKRAVMFLQSKAILSQTRHNREKEYKRWYRKNFPGHKELVDQKRSIEKFEAKPLISVILPTYNTKTNHLRSCIESVIDQTYENWELCIADDASTQEAVRDVISEYAGKDKRIKVKFRSSNGHICEASNSALDLSTGEYVALLDHDDYLWPNALFEVVKLINEHPEAEFIYTDEDKIDESGKTHLEPFFKPDWSYDFLRSINYITHFSVIDRDLVKKLGGFRKGYEGAQDWDLFLRVSRATDKIYHIPKVLYSWRKTEASTASQPSAKDYAYVNQKKALEDDIKSRGLQASLSWEIPFSMWRIDYELSAEPKISIIIPTKNQHNIVEQCLRSISEKTTYRNYETIVVDTGSTDDAVWALYDEYRDKVNLKVVKWHKAFNFSSACNFGAEHATGEYLLFLNNDTEVISPDWLESMVGYASQKQIGAVGSKLYYPDGKLQHGGIIMGVGGRKGTPGIAGHFFPGFQEDPPQDPGQLLYDGGTRNFAAVTAACLMVEKNKFEEVKGFDSKFKIAFNDVDFCLKLLQKGHRNVYLPHVKLFHHESISVGQPGSKQRDLEVFGKEIEMMLTKWGEIIANDPYYHPEFKRDIASARLNF